MAMAAPAALGAARAAAPVAAHGHGVRRLQLVRPSPQGALARRRLLLSAQLGQGRGALGVGLTSWSRQPGQGGPAAAERGSSCRRGWCRASEPGKAELVEESLKAPEGAVEGPGGRLQANGGAAPPEDERGDGGAREPVLQGAGAELVLPPWQTRWQVPWGGREAGLCLGTWLVSFVVSAIVVQLAARQFNLYPSAGDIEGQALFLLASQIFRTALGIFVVFATVRPFQPLPQDFFAFGPQNPLSWEDGWLLWALIGFVAAGVSVELVAMAAVTLQGGQEAPRGSADALLQLLPIIGASPVSTAALLGVAGVCAPVLEETVFRGFLMTSLTKWMPVPWAALVSASAFALAHLTPDEFPKLATLGFILGLTYAKTRNLLTPVLIHALWNTGIIILLTLLRLQGYDINQLLLLS